MTNSYPKTEKLKSKTTIDLLFSQGKSVSKYPLRLVYCPLDFTEKEPIKMGVSVSKKYFKKADKALLSSIMNLLTIRKQEP